LDLTRPKTTVRLPLGVHDHLPERSSALQKQQESIARVFDLAGYDRVETPAFELLDVIELGLGDAHKARLFRALDPSTGEVLVLRPDFTAQVARMVVARMGERPRPLRIRYQGRVLRATDPLGRGFSSRDVFQAGAELIGSAEPWADAEILALGLDALAHVTEPLTIDLGHALIVESLIAAEGVDEGAVHAALAVKDGAAIRRLAPAIEPLLELFGGIEVLSVARRVLAKAPATVSRAIDELERVGAALLLSSPSARLTFDLGEERGLGYYTGVFFHGYLEGAPDAVLMGGRYDRLLARYGRAEPAVGLAIDVDAIVSVTRGARAVARGVVFAERDLASPSFAAEAASARARGERAVLVDRKSAEAYARANRYRMIVELSDSGERIERDVGPNPEP
jgi:ATP phosphoribosyltransferase regulatory subunit